MLKKKNLWRGLTMVFALLLAVSMMAGNILELYRTSVDAFLGTRSTQTVTEQSDDESDAWTYKSEFTTAKEAYEGFKDFAIETSQETFALLKNENGALPLAKDAKITMLGVRSYAPVYGNSGGSVPDGKSTVQIFDAFTERGFQLNPETLAAYEAFFADKEWTKPQFGGGILPAYAEITAYDDPHELTLDELKGADFDDPRWDELVGKVTIDEFLNFASNAFHNIQNIDSVGLPQYAADDGPNGSDSHYLTEGSYQGTPYADAADYDYGTRVGPTPENIAYSWNKELAYRVGEITLGESTLVLNLPIMIGPGMNIHRHGYNARGAEYYSEDPVLSGYTGSAVVQGAQSKGTLVNIKHAAFNDQEINRSGIAVFMTEQKARELELRNLQQAFEGNGKPASFEADPSRDDTYTVGALGVMSSYNRIGAVASSANAGVQVQIMRNEWGFKGYNVTDFTGVTLHASPKESILAGTTAFCGFGTDDSITYWNADALKGDRTMLLAIKQNIHYLLYALANSAAMNGVNSTTRTISVMTWWRMTYRVCIYGFAALTALCALLYVVSAVKSKKQKTAKEA